MDKTEKSTAVLISTSIRETIAPWMVKEVLNRKKPDSLCAGIVMGLAVSMVAVIDGTDMMNGTDLSEPIIASKAAKIAASICIFASDEYRKSKEEDD